MAVIGNLINTIVVCLLALVSVVIAAGIIMRVARDYISSEKSVDAVVVNKQAYDRRIYGRAQAPYTKREYVITFDCQGKERHFEVSELSYGNYRINQRGILRYKGGRLIDFQP